MVMEPLPDVDDLVWLFGAEPEYPYAEDERGAGCDWRAAWPYTRFIFTYSGGDTTLRMDLEPGYEQVRLSVAQCGTEVVDLLLREVATMSIERLPEQRNVLRLDFQSGFPGRSLLVTMTPHIFLGWEVGRPAWEPR